MLQYFVYTSIRQCYSIWSKPAYFNVTVLRLNQHTSMLQYLVENQHTSMLQYVMENQHTSMLQYFVYTSIRQCYSTWSKPGNVNVTVLSGEPAYVNVTVLSGETNIRQCYST
jgi:hypothetical protein